MSMQTNGNLYSIYQANQRYIMLFKADQPTAKCIQSTYVAGQPTANCIQSK